MMRQSNQLALAILLGTSLTACNGGGGGGDDSGGNKSTSAVVLTDSNKQQVAHNAVGAVDAASSVSSSGAGILGGVQVSGQQQKVQWPLLLARRGIELLNGANFAPALLGGVAQSITLPCVGGGSMDVATNDADNSQTVSSGDSVTARFNNCRETAGGVTAAMSGSFTLVLNQASGNFGQVGAVFNVGMSMPAPGLQVAVTENGRQVATTVTGDMAMGVQIIAGGALVSVSSNTLSAATSDGEQFSYANFTMTASDSGSRSSFSVNGTIAGSSNDFAGAYTINMKSPDTPLIFSNNRNYPDSGEMRITGANGTLTLTVQPNAQVLLTLNADGKTSTSTVGWCSIGDC